MATATIPTTFGDAEALLRAPTTRNDRRKVGNNTYVEWLAGHPVLRLHATRIVHFWKPGVYSFNTGGWQTVTTKDRLNAFLRPHGYYISQKNHTWSWWKRTGSEHVRIRDYQEGDVLAIGHIFTAEEFAKVSSVIS